MNRVVAVARMQSANRLWSVGFPMLVLLSGFLSLVAVWAGRPPSVGNAALGASLAPALVLFHFISVTQIYPLCAGLSVTRRDCLAGSALVAGVQAGVLSLGVVALAALEGATGGWGVGVWGFRDDAVVDENVAVRWFAVAAVLLAYAAFGVLMGVVHVRWGRLGLAVLGLAVLFLGVLAIVVLVLLVNVAVPALGPFAAPPAVVVYGLLPLLFALLVGGAGYLVLRRAATH